MPATTLDMSLIANDVVLKGRVQAVMYDFSIATIQDESGSVGGHTTRKQFAQQVLNNPNAYIQGFVWCCATNQILADSVIAANGGVNFTADTDPAVIAKAITTTTPTQTGATDQQISNAVANSWNMLAGA